MNTEARHRDTLRIRMDWGCLVFGVIGILVIFSILWMALLAAGSM